MLILLILKTIYGTTEEIQPGLQLKNEYSITTDVLEDLRVYPKKLVYINPKIFDVHFLTNKVLLQKKANRKENVLLKHAFSRLGEKTSSLPDSFTFSTDSNSLNQKELPEKRTKIFLNKNQLYPIKEKDSIYESECNIEHDYLRNEAKPNESTSNNIEIKHSNSLEDSLYFEVNDSNSRPVFKESSIESVYKHNPYIKGKPLKRLSMEHSDLKRSRDTKFKPKNEYKKTRGKIKDYRKTCPNNLSKQQRSSFHSETKKNLSTISKEAFINHMIRIIQTTNPTLPIETCKEIVKFIIQNFRNLKDAGLFLIFINYTTRGFNLFYRRAHANPEKCLFSNLFNKFVFNEQDLSNAINNFSSQYENFDSIEEGYRILERLFLKVLSDNKIELIHYYNVDFRLYVKRNLHILFFENPF